MDRDNSGVLDHNEFKQAMRNYRVTVVEEELNILIKIFDKDHSGAISYEEFLRSIVGEMSPLRRNICIQAFKKLDNDCSGSVDLLEIKMKYNAKKHPDVMLGKKTEDEVLY